MNTIILIGASIVGILLVYWIWLSVEMYIIHHLISSDSTGDNE